MEAMAAPGGVQACRDCGTLAGGRFCPACGQPTHVSQDLHGLWHETLHGLLHLDGSLWRTLPLLALHPGRLMREWIDGRRTRYLGPVGLFLGAAILMFLALGVAGGPAAPAPCAAPGRGAEVAAGQIEALAPAGLGLDADPALVAARDWARAHLPAGVSQRIAQALSNPALTMAGVKKAASKLGVLLVPLSLPILWLVLGIRPGARAFELSVFALYSIGFMSLFLTLILLLGAAGLVPWQMLWVPLVVVPPVHLWRQLREGFALTPSGAAWRAAALSVAAVMTLAGFLLLLLGWGLLH